MEFKTKTASNIQEEILLIEEVKYALSEYNLSDDEADNISRNYLSHTSDERDYMELCNYCALVDEQYHFLASKGYPEEAIRKVMVESSKFIIRNSDYKKIILKYLGPEVEEHIYIHRPSILISSPEVIYARYAFINDYNKKAQLEGKKTYSLYSVATGSKIKYYFNTSDDELKVLYPLPSDLKLELCYPDNPKKRQFMKTMLLMQAYRKQQQEQ